MEDDEKIATALGTIQIVRTTIASLQLTRPQAGRALAAACTKLDEARMWLVEAAQD